MRISEALSILPQEEVVKKPFMEPVMEKVDVNLTESGPPTVFHGDGSGSYFS